MSSTNEVDQRLTELEIKASLTEDLVDRLNEIVASQQARIDLLTRELGRLAGRLAASEDTAPSPPRDEIPPHY